jgi:hypothetical protein
MKTSWTLGPTPNARLVYRAMDISEAQDWAGLIKEGLWQWLDLEHVLREKSPYQLAHNKGHLYFFSIPKPEGLHDLGPVWVAREVIGPPIEAPDSEFSVYDLDSSEVLTSTSFSLSKLDELVNLIEAGQWPAKMASTWRLEWDLDSGGECHFRVQAFR